MVAEASSAIQRIQKALIEMNVQLSSVLSDISGVSGMSMIAAILDGERNPWTLAARVQSGVKATTEDISKSLEGNWREELLFVLRQEVELYRIYQQKIDDCDLELRKHLESFGSVVDLQTQPIGPKPKGKKGSNNALHFDLRTELYRITGIDWAQVNGMDVLTAQTVIAEAGADLSAFASENNFASWLGLCPTNEKSAAKSGSRQPCHSGPPQRSYHAAAKPKLSGRAISPPTYPSGRPESAITAMARKLACLFYRLIKHGQ